MNNIQNKPKVRLDEIGLYLRTIQLDYKPNSHQEMADLITQHFNVLCLVEDIEHYLELEYNYSIKEDFELEDRRVDYFNKINKSNPFY